MIVHGLHVNERVVLDTTDTAVRHGELVRCGVDTMGVVTHWGQ